MSLDALLHALNDGEPGAERRLFKQLALELLPFFKRRVQPLDAEDLTQETMLVIAQKLRERRFEPAGPTSFRSFAFRVAHYLLRDDYRAKQRHPQDLPSLPDWCDVPELSADEGTMILEQRTLLHAALAAITTRYRRALESRLRDEDPRVFADAEGIDLGTVRTRIHRGLVRVNAEIEARRRTPVVISPAG
jgi:RNA polymerase sigma factor (sigma-70 family)